VALCGQRSSLLAHIPSSYSQGKEGGQTLCCERKKGISIFPSDLASKNKRGKGFGLSLSEEKKKNASTISFLLGAGLFQEGEKEGPIRRGEVRFLTTKREGGSCLFSSSMEEGRRGKTMKKSLNPKRRNEYLLMKELEIHHTLGRGEGEGRPLRKRGKATLFLKRTFCPLGRKEPPKREKKRTAEHLMAERPFFSFSRRTGKNSMGCSRRRSPPRERKKKKEDAGWLRRRKKGREKERGGRAAKKRGDNKVLLLRHSFWGKKGGKKRKTTILVQNESGRGGGEGNGVFS